MLLLRTLCKHKYTTQVVAQHTKYNLFCSFFFCPYFFFSPLHSLNLHLLLFFCPLPQSKSFSKCVVSLILYFCQNIIKSGDYQYNNMTHTELLLFKRVICFRHVIKFAKNCSIIKPPTPFPINVESVLISNTTKKNPRFFK